MIDFGKKVLIFDGAMGTMLQRAGLKLGKIPELSNFENPDLIKSIHEEYIKSGADLITTNTFGANKLKLKQCSYSVEEVISQGVFLARKATKGKDTLVALDVGPLGELLEPLGQLTFDEAYELFREQMVAGEKAGADVILIETMTDLYELKAAILAAKEHTNLPVFVTMSFEKTGRTFTGCMVESMVMVAEGLGVDALGVNCSLGPVELSKVVETLLQNTTIPIIVQPNAGLPKIVNGETVFDISVEEFTNWMKSFVDKGVAIVGGCCGTTPDYIHRMAQEVKGKEISKRVVLKQSRVCTPTQTVCINSVKVIGERINPTGKKQFQQALLSGNMEYVLEQAISQVDAGADILDVNVGLPGIDEVKTMGSILKQIQSVVQVPLQIDSSSKEVIEQGLRYYNGKAIVNSVNGEDSVLDAILPVVKKYGAAVVGLTMSDEGIPSTAEERTKIAGHIISKALGYGIPKEDIYIDCLTLTASAQQEEVFETIRGIRMVKEQFGVKTVLGVSNISFGLPNRNLINETFLSMALSHGLDLPILNPNAQGMMDVLRAYRVLSNVDQGAKEYIGAFGGGNPQEKAGEERDLKQIIILGLKENAREATKNMLKTVGAFEIVENCLIPALDVVGLGYEKGQLFLPQLIQAAETVKIAVEVIKEQNQAKQELSKGKIILATVKGDVHDIGKNIVKIILENYGYEIIDLGRDVKSEVILSAISEHQVKLVGLSALMTTTVASMEETIALIKEHYPQVITMVGGAVLTEDYAKSIGANYYGRDARMAVEIAKQVL